jgi:hypothetical protein
MQDTISDIHFVGYMWTAKLTAGPINNGQTAVLQAPGVAANVNVDQVNWQVSTGGKVYVAPQVSVAFGANFINVTNNTGASWPQHDDVTLCTNRAILKASREAFNEIFRLHGYAENHETRLATVEGQDTSALEAQIADLNTRVTALESAADPSTLPA